MSTNATALLQARRPTSTVIVRRKTAILEQWHNLDCVAS